MLAFMCELCIVGKLWKKLQWQLITPLLSFINERRWFGSVRKGLFER